MFGFGKSRGSKREKNKDNQPGQSPTSITSENSSEIYDNAGRTGRAFISALDRAVNMQSSAVESYLNRLRKKHPEASAEELQKLLDKHFKRAVVGTGGTAGAASTIPGIGFITGALAISAESVAFLDVAALYTVASASLRGLDIHDKDQRRALILIGLLGSQGTAIVDTLLPAGVSGKGKPSLRALGRLSGPAINDVNNRLTRMALRTVTKRIRGAFIGKLMPLGIGIVLGGVGNNRLAKKLISQVNIALGPPNAKGVPATHKELPEA